MGFSIPIDSWLRSDLKEWMSDLLSKDKIEKVGLRFEAIEGLMNEHLSNKNNHGNALWTILTYIEWFEHYIDN